MDFKVELENFNGPLDLLLYLIKRDELDILDIPIAQITEAYIGYVEVLKGLHADHHIDIDLISEFLVMAATLMEIKSAMLLPTPPPVDMNIDSPEQVMDPRAELIRQLLEYKKLKDHAALLEQQRQTHADRFPRVPAMREIVGEDIEPPLDLEEVQIWDLLASFSNIMGEIGSRRTQHEIVDDDTPIELHAADLEDRLKRDGSMTLREIFNNRRNRAEMIGVFLAILELVRQKRIIGRLKGDVSDGGVEIAFEIASDEHRKTFPQASLHLARDEEEVVSGE